MAEGVSLMVSGATFCCWIVSFLSSKACDASIVIIFDSVEFFLMKTHSVEFYRIP